MLIRLQTKDSRSTLCETAHMRRLETVGRHFAPTCSAPPPVAAAPAAESEAGHGGGGGVGQAPEWRNPRPGAAPAVAVGGEVI